MLGGPLAIRNVAKDEQADLDEFSAVFRPCASCRPLLGDALEASNDVLRSNQSGLHRFGVGEWPGKRSCLGICRHGVFE